MRPGHRRTSARCCIPMNASGSYSELADELSDRLNTEEDPEPKVTEISHLQRAHAVWEVSWRLYTDELAFQAHLWGRFRDMVKVYLGALGVLGLALRHAADGWSESPPGTVLGVGILILAFVAATACGLQLIGVFAGAPYMRLHPDDARAIFHDQAKFYEDLVGRKRAPPRPGEIFPRLTALQYLEGGQVAEAGLAVALDRVAATTLHSAVANAGQNAQRTRRLEIARFWLLAHSILAVLGWGVVFLFRE